MYTTPNRKRPDSSLFIEPIFFETPRIRSFYEKNSDLSDERPNKRPHIIFTLMGSPADPQSIAKRNLLMLKNMDIFSEGFETNRSFETPDEKHHETPQVQPKFRDMNTTHTYKACESQEKQEKFENDKSTTVCSQLMSDFDMAEVSEQNEDEREPMERTSEQIFKFGPLDRDAEVRKRKRKSAQQLKILKSEFEKDDCWDKEKIVTVAKITGLSESQVYKWCWDQKKKLDMMGNEKGRGICFDDKENILPKSHSNLISQSKTIMKMKKKGKPFNPLRTTQKSTMENWDDFNPFEEGGHIGHLQLQF